MIKKITCPVGVMGMTDRLKAPELIEFVQFLEKLNYESFWVPELFGREIMANTAYCIAQTKKIKIAPGIANIYVRDPHATVQARQTLAEFANGRFILGLGVSNIGVQTTRGHKWRSPVEKFNEYLDAMSVAQNQITKYEQYNAAVEPELASYDNQGPLLIAAHGPALQKIAKTRTDGALTYLMSPEHTKVSRERLGPKANLTVVIPTLAETDEIYAKKICRKSLAYYMELDYYQREWKKIGFEDKDFLDKGSDRLLDYIVAWGSQETIKNRIKEHVNAGASRIVFFPLDTGFGDATDSPTLKSMASLITS